MNKIILLLIFGMMRYGAFSQSLAPDLISSAGNSDISSTVFLDWSLGEICVETFTSGTVQLTQGFQQSDFTSTSLKDVLEPIEISIYPNPAQSHFRIIKQVDFYSELQIEFFDTKGMCIQRLKMTDDDMEIQTADLNSGMYYVRIYNPSSQAVKTLKLIKI